MDGHKDLQVLVQIPSKYPRGAVFEQVGGAALNEGIYGAAFKATVLKLLEFSKISEAPGDSADAIVSVGIGNNLLFPRLYGAELIVVVAQVAGRAGDGDTGITRKTSGPKAVSEAEVNVLRVRAGDADEIGGDLVQVLASPERGHHHRVTGKVRKQAKLDLAKVHGYENLAGRGDVQRPNGRADFPVFRVARDILLVGAR